MAQAPKKTPLYDTHVKNGGRIVDFGGWALPVQFSGSRKHNACRTAAALGMYPNMRAVVNKEVLTFQMILVNDVSKIYPGNSSTTHATSTEA